MKKRLPGMMLGLLVSVAALALLLRRDLGDVRDELAHARYWTVIPCVAVSVVGLGLRSLRWRVLLGGRIATAHSFHILNVSYFVNGVLPLRIGELARAALAARLNPPVQVLTSLSTILVERLLDTLAVFALLGLTLAVLPGAGIEIGVVGLALGIGALVGIVALVIFANRPAWAHSLLAALGRYITLLRRPAFKSWLDLLLDGIAPLASSRAVALAAGWTAVGWAASVVAGYILLYAIFDDPTWTASMAMVALASFAIAVPAVPGNLGPFEAAVVFGLASADLVAEMTGAPAVAFALLLHIVNLLTYITLGLIGLWAERVDVGEINRAARMLRARGEPS